MEKAGYTFLMDYLMSRDFLDGGFLDEGDRDSIVTDQNGIACGHISASRFSSEGEVRSEALLALSRNIPADVKWPLVLLGHIEVDENRRGAGIGTVALRKFLLDVSNCGVRVVLLRVGHFDGSSIEGWDKALSLAAWYQREGFRPLVDGGMQRAREDVMWAAKSIEWCWFWRDCTVSPLLSS